MKCISEETNSSKKLTEKEKYEKDKQKRIEMILVPKTEIFKPTDI